LQAPGRVPHSHEARHIHEGEEIFVLLQGKAVVHLNRRGQPLRAGDSAVIARDENHHLESDKYHQGVIIWLHRGPERHHEQA